MQHQAIQAFGEVDVSGRCQEPQQLMDTFTELEELNLFLIQSSQVAELDSTVSPAEREREREDVLECLV